MIPSILQAERARYLAEAKELKQQLEDLESKPRRAGLRERKTDSSGDSKEVENLREDLRKCEDKLRKYVKYSERLESDKKGIADAITDSGVDVAGDDALEMVASLCERLISIEEECDALAGCEKKAGEHLNELHSLKEKYSKLESQVQSYEEGDKKLRTALDECKSNLKRAQEKIAVLKKDKESLAEMAETAKKNISEMESAHRLQMQYLEKENLEVDSKLKKTRAELSEKKALLDTLQNGAFGNDQTEELQGLSNLLGNTSSTTKRATIESTSKRPPLQSSSKRILGSSKKRAESPATENYSTDNDNESLISKKTRAFSSTSKKRAESPLAESDSLDKENLVNKKPRTLSSTIQSPFGSAKKKKKSANPFSSVKKAARRTKNAFSDDSPTKHYALGDSEPTVDVTSECNQS